MKETQGGRRKKHRNTKKRRMKSVPWEHWEEKAVKEDRMEER